jgi:two-component system LytT family response regulator
MSHKPFIQLPTKRGIEIISPEEIISISSDDKTLCINLESGRKHSINMAISRADEILSQPYLVRCHQRHIVNLLKIKEIVNRNSTLVFFDGREIPVSRTYKKALKNALDTYCEKLSS